ncbi:U4/U6 x U5 tri-snRNP complex subunit Prp1, partial [Coemansia helicoidea]
FVPTSVVLWKAAVALEPPDDARILLAHAVELVPLSTELWLALARLETYANAQKVLNRARRAVPASHEIWIAAARLEEDQQRQPDQEPPPPGAEARVARIMAKAVTSLANSGAALGREAWFEQARQCEADGYGATCRAIVQAAGSVGFDSDDAAADRCDAWVAEAEAFLPAGVETARAVMALALDAQPVRVDLWRAAADVERAHGAPADLERLLKRAVQYCPQAEVLWLMAAKEKWARQADVPGARVILEEAFAANPASEAIVLAAVKLESETGQHARALALLERARSTRFGDAAAGSAAATGTPRVWMKSAALLRQLGRTAEALQLATQGAAHFPAFPKLWLVKAQLEDAGEARQTLSRALKQCPREPVLWAAAAELERQAAGGATSARARAILERARVYIPRDPALWLAAVRLEAHESIDAARALLARALQECPRAGALWAEAVLLEPRAQRKAKSVDAMRSTDARDPHVTIVVARRPRLWRRLGLVAAL